MQTAPGLAGFAPERLERITDHLKRNYIDNGKIVGCQTVVARSGHIAYFSSLGQMDRERQHTMADDTLFRIYSMSKPITSVALMQLYEQGYFQLNDAVSRVIPAWKNHEVYVNGEGERIETKQPERPMTFRHVLSHSGGLTYGGTDHPVDKIYRTQKVRGEGETLQTFIDKLARAASEDMYKATQEGASAQQAQPGSDTGGNGHEQTQSSDSKVEDVPFEEVK